MDGTHHLKKCWHNCVPKFIKKANTIAVEKYESNRLDDAYLLLARAEFLKKIRVFQKRKRDMGGCVILYGLGRLDENFQKKKANDISKIIPS